MKKILGFLLLPLFFITACSAVFPNGQSETIHVTASEKTELSNLQTETLTPSPNIITIDTPTDTDKENGKKTPEIPATSNASFIAEEITGCPTDNSIIVNVIPANNMTIYYEYGTVPGVYDQKTNSQLAAAGVPINTLIEGLLPGTRYYYRLHYDNSTGQEHSFTTQPAPGSAFTFDLQGDSHPERVGKEFNADLYTRTLQSAGADQPDFFLTMGDDFSVDALKTVNPQTVRNVYLAQRQWLSLVGAPVFLVNGNHEQAALANLDGTANNVAVWAQNNRNEFFPQPAPDDFYSGDEDPVEFIGLLRDYYAFTWGDALFVVIDPYWHSNITVDNMFGTGHEQQKNRDLWQVTLGDAQYQWFNETLENSDAKYKFVFTHHVLGTGRGGIEAATRFEWGNVSGLAANRPGWDKTIQQVMADNNVTIFFQGHDHIFAHQELDGVVYQTLPEPANPNYAFMNEKYYQSGDLYPNSGHVRVTVSAEGVTVDYVRSYLDRPDEIAYSYTVQ